MPSSGLDYCLLTIYSYSSVTICLAYNSYVSRLLKIWNVAKVGRCMINFSVKLEVNLYRI